MITITISSTPSPLDFSIGLDNIDDIEVAGLLTAPAAADLLQWIHDFLTPIARWSPTSIDDELVRFIAALQQSPDLLAWIDAIVARLNGTTSPFTVQGLVYPEAELRRLAVLADVDYGQIVMVLLPLLLELLRKAIEYFGKAIPKPPAPTNPPASDYQPRTKGRCP